MSYNPEPWTYQTSEEPNPNPDLVTSLSSHYWWCYKCSLKTLGEEAPAAASRKKPRLEFDGDGKQLQQCQSVVGRRNEQSLNSRRRPPWVYCCCQRIISWDTRVTKSDWKSFQRDYKIIIFETDLTEKKFLTYSTIHIFKSLRTSFVKLKTAFIVVKMWKIKR